MNIINENQKLYKKIIDNKKMNIYKILKLNMTNNLKIQLIGG